MNRVALAGILSLVPTLAQANTEACFVGFEQQPLVGLRVAWSPSPLQAVELTTDGSGCVDVPTVAGVSRVEIDVHAANRVIQMVHLGAPVVRTLTVSDGSTTVLDPEHVAAERLRALYDEGLRGYAPYLAAAPLGGTLAEGPHLSADLASPFGDGLEPIPLGGLPPRIHMAGDSSLADLLLPMALYASQLPEEQLGELQQIYVEEAIANFDPTQSAPTTAEMAYLFAFGLAGRAFALAESNDESDFVDMAFQLTTPEMKTLGDDTVSAGVFHVLFHNFAREVGLAYVIETYADCAVFTLDDYASCIADREGLDSFEYEKLYHAAGDYGLELDQEPDVLLGDLACATVVPGAGLLGLGVLLVGFRRRGREPLGVR